MAPQIYDSDDPNLPNLPHDFNINESDQEFSDLETIQSQDSNETNNLFTNHHDPITNSIPSSVSTHQQQEHNHQKKKQHKRRKNRKYSDSAYSSTAAKQRISWEPGIDINTTDVVISSIGSSVTITDYSLDRYRVEHTEIFSNILNTMDIETDSDFYLQKNDSIEYDIKSKQSVGKLKMMLNERPLWSKVRWINVNGLSWEAISTIGEKYDLHRLAIEDMIDIPQRTKTDIYSGHLFGVLPLIKLMRTRKHERHDYNSWWNQFLKLINMYDYLNEEDEKRKDDADDHDDHDDHDDDDDSFKHNGGNKKNISLTQRIGDSHEMRRLNENFYPINYSKRRLRILDDHRPLSYRDLFVGVEQSSFFLTKDNTVISFFESSGDDIENAILSRISTNETILRTSCDPSILVQSIIDAIVDIIYPVITAYRKRLSEFEIDILTNPDIKHTQSLHLMSGELSKLRRTILPTTALINSLKDHSKKNNHNDENEKDINYIKKINKESTKINFTQSNFMSSASELYLSDVSDHTQMFTDEIEGMITSIENLVGLIFNTISTESNNAMQQLSLVTVIFLPLSFWTGYYGMNFEKFEDLENHVSYYWKIAIPFSIGLLILITWSFIKKSISDFNRQIKRKLQEMKINKDFKKRQKLKQERKNRRTTMSNSFNRNVENKV